MIIYGLVQNIALLVTFMVTHQMLMRRFNRDILAVKLLSGILYGVLGMLVMLTPLHVAPGIFFDGRSIILSVAGLFGGTVVAAVASLMCAGLRYWQGGGGVIMGIGTIVSSAVIGVMFNKLRKQHEGIMRPWPLWGFGVLVHAVMLAWIPALPDSAQGEVFRSIGLPVITLYPVATMLIGLLFLDREKWTNAQQALSESARKYRELVENSRTIILKWNTEGNITFLNEYGQKLFGYAAEEVTGKSVIGTILAETDSSGRDMEYMVEDIMNNPEMYRDNENENITRDGRRLWIRWSNRAIRDQKGAVTGIISIGNDITERKQAEKALRENRGYQQALISCSPLALYACDLEGTVLIWNESAERMFGWRTDEVMGKPLPIVPPEKQEEFAELRRKVINGESFSGMELVRCRKDGSHFDASLSTAPIVSGDGEIIGIMGAMEDITNRKQAEQHLNESEESLRQQNQFIETIIDNLPIGLSVNSTLDNRTLYINRKFAEIYGWTKEKLDTVEHFLACVYPDPEYHREITTRITEDISSGDPARMVWDDIRITTQDGGEKYVSAANIPLPEQNLMISTVRDVTNRRKTEIALQESESLFRNLFNHHEAVKLLIDGDTGYIVDANQAAVNFYGWTLGELRRMRLQDINTLPSEEVTSEIEKVKKHKRVFFEFRHRRADGSVRDVEVYSSRIEVRGRGMLHSIIHDVTDRKVLEAQLSQSQKMESIGRLAGGVAHDFNNILTVILGNSQLALLDLDPGTSLYQDITEIRDTAERATEITRQLLTFSRKQTITPRVLNLNEVINARKKMLTRLVGEDVDFYYILEPDVWNIEMDPNQVDQIIMNFSVNARDAIAGVGTITIETKNVNNDEAYTEKTMYAPPGDYVLLSYSDSGRGMDAETRRKIFEPFFTTKEEGKGTGLGLSTVYGIVKQNGGIINVYSEPDIGTTFNVYFPRHIGEQQQHTVETPDIPLRGSETIMIVEDEKHILNLAKKVLRQYGYTVMACGTTDYAVERAGDFADTIDLLLTDVVMPSMNGKELQECIASIKPGIKTIFMSGYTADIIAHKGVLEKGVDFIQKPFSVNQLLQKVREVLDRE